jgi:hypothetical protein
LKFPRLAQSNRCAFNPSISWPRRRFCALVNSLGTCCTLHTGNQWLYPDFAATLLSISSAGTRPRSAVAALSCLADALAGSTW